MAVTETKNIASFSAVTETETEFRSVSNLFQAKQKSVGCRLLISLRISENGSGVMKKLREIYETFQSLKFHCAALHIREVITLPLLTDEDFKVDPQHVGLTTRNETA